MLTIAELPQAFRNYIQSSVLIEILPIVPEQGVMISPGEEFALDIKCTNSTPNDGIGLQNVRFHIWIVDPSIGKLRDYAYSPSGSYPTGRGTTTGSNPTGGATGRSATSNRGGGMTTGRGAPAQPALVDELTYQFARLAAGECVEVIVSHCLAEPHTGDASYLGGQTNIKCEIIADIDINSVFPRDQRSPAATTTLSVVA